MDRYRGRELQPGEAVQTDDQIDAFVARKVESAYHPSCTCRIGQPDDIATAAVFLASDDSGWINGQRIEAAGGAR